MPIYRHDRLPGGSHYIRETSWEEEAAGAIIGGAASAAGWVIGSGISGLRSLARTSRDRRLVRAVAALDEASEADDPDRFLELASSFTRQHPEFGSGWAALAEALQRKGHFDSAIDALERAIEQGLDETEAHMLRADIYDDAGRPGAVIQEFTALAQAASPELRQLGLLGRARVLMQIGDLSQALKDANEAVGLMPDESAYVMRGHIYRSMSENDKSLNDYSRAIQLRPDLADLLENRAELYETLGRAEEAHSDRSAAAAAAAAAVPLHESLPLTRNTDWPPRQAGHGRWRIAGATLAGLAILTALLLGVASIFGQAPDGVTPGPSGGVAGDLAVSTVRDPANDQSGYSGDWFGTLNQHGSRTDIAESIGVSLTFTHDDSAVAGYVTYTTLDCFGTLSLISGNSESATYLESIESGPCDDGGVWTMQRAGDALAVSWSKPGVSYAVSGVLTRS